MYNCPDKIIKIDNARLNPYKKVIKADLYLIGNVFLLLKILQSVRNDIIATKEIIKIKDIILK